MPGRQKQQISPTDARLGQAATLERLRAIKPREARYAVVDNDDIIRALAVARRELQEAQARRKKRLDALLPLVKGSGDDALTQAASLFDAPDEEVNAAEAAVAAAQEALQAATSHILLRAIPRDRYDALIADHKPTKEQKEEVGPELEFNPATFPSALVAACAVDPEMTEADVSDLMNSWGGADAIELFNTAYLLCTSRRAVGNA
jgi:hypothetical protein